MERTENDDRLLEGKMGESDGSRPEQVYADVKENL